jgi:23S rRNA (adenine2503-C2)-methyltransferase
LNLKNLQREELREAVVALGLKPYRGDQIFRWVWRRGAESVDAMTDLSKTLRERLAGQVAIRRLDPASCDTAADGTSKLLIALDDGRHVESVLIPEGERRTLCVSTQVGCAMGCTFCATATMGLLRDLEPWEITEQVLIAERILLERGDTKSFQIGRGQGGRVDRRLTNLVFMGMGEPLHNLEATVAACRILTDEHGLAFPPSRITVSTVGLADRIPSFLERTGVNLAISLNASNDGVREQIMPVNKRFDMDELLRVVSELPLSGRERVTFEYVLLAGVNDGGDQARELARWLRGVVSKVKINLIPFNPHEGSEFSRPDHETVEEFKDLLIRGGVEKVNVRRPRGDAIQAACGQLAIAKKGK